MITLDPQLENQLMTLAAEKGLSISELIKGFILDYQAEQEAIKQADNSHSDYKRLALLGGSEPEIKKVPRR